MQERFLFDLRFSLSEYEDDLDADHVNTSLFATVGYSISQRLDLQITIPYHDYEIDSNGAEDVDESGIGDISITAIWSAYEAEPAKTLFDRSQLSLILGVKLATGEDDLDRFAGTLAEIVPLGSGTTDLTLGASYAIPLGESVSIYDVFSFTFPLGENDDLPPPGTELGLKSTFTFRNTAGIQARFTDWFGAYLTVTYEKRAEDSDLANDASHSHLFFTPGLTISGSGFTIDLGYRVAHEMVTLGITRRF